MLVDTSSTVYIVYIVICTCPCCVCVYKLYIVFTTQLSAVVHIVQSLHDTTVACALDPKRGPERSLFTPALRGLLHLRLGQERLYVHIVHSTWRHNCRSFLRPEKGTRTVPLFYPTLRGFLYFDLVKNKSGSPFYLWTQGPPVNTCKYLPTTTCG